MGGPPRRRAGAAPLPLSHPAGRRPPEGGQPGVLRRGDRGGPAGPNPLRHAGEQGPHPVGPAGRLGDHHGSWAVLRAGPGCCRHRDRQKDRLSPPGGGPHQRAGRLLPPAEGAAAGKIPHRRAPATGSGFAGEAERQVGGGRPGRPAAVLLPPPPAGAGGPLRRPPPFPAGGGQLGGVLGAALDPGGGD